MVNKINEVDVSGVVISLYEDSSKEKPTYAVVMSTGANKKRENFKTMEGANKFFQGLIDATQLMAQKGIIGHASGVAPGHVIAQNTGECECGSWITGSPRHSTWCSAGKTILRGPFCRKLVDK